MEEVFSASALKSYALFQHVKYLNLVSFSIYLCEYLHFLELEIALIWRAEWNTGIFIYLFSRLLPFFDVPLAIFYRLYPKVPTLPNNVCDGLYKVETWCTIFGIISSEVVMVMIIYALSNRSRVIFWWLTVQVVGFSIAGCVLWGILLESLQFGDPELPVPTGCYVVGGKYLFAGIGFILLTLNEFLLMLAAVAMGISRYRHSNNTLVKTLYRDGTLYYVFNFLVSLGQVIVLLLGPTEYADLLTTFQRVMHSILAARVMLNARNTANLDLNNKDPSGVVTGTSFAFDGPLDTSRTLSTSRFHHAESGGSDSEACQLNRSGGSAGIEMTRAEGVAGGMVGDSSGIELHEIQAPSRPGTLTI